MKGLAFPIMLHGALAAFIAAAALLGYDRWVARPELAIGIVDLNAVYRDKEAEIARSLTEAHTDAERERAMQAARDFSQRLPMALEALPRECRCLVVLSSAVVTPAPSTLDLTPALRRHLDR